jgi:NAD(P)-dependent dehydrogenase (short-subunit alcohol dehydrogenase family)
MHEQATDLRSKRVVVLGGSSGIGLAVAEQASTQGAEIVIASSNPERVQNYAAGIRSQKSRPRSVSPCSFSVNAVWLVLPGTDWSLCARPRTQSGGSSFFLRRRPLRLAANIKQSEERCRDEG